MVLGPIPHLLFPALFLRKRKYLFENVKACCLKGKTIYRFILRYVEQEVFVETISPIINLKNHAALLNDISEGYGCTVMMMV